MQSARNWRRRDFLKAVGLGTAAAAASAKTRTVWSDPVSPVENVLTIDPAPLFELSPYLYMQFMEPLGVTDSSVDAAWDFVRDEWREDVLEASRDLAPTLLRWGGCFCSYYRWKEGVGPRASRPPMINLLWGGIYNNQVGTGEFVDFCRAVGADPLIVVNFESDGRPYWASPPKGGPRSGDAREAAEWVDYCNNPRNADRIAHGRKDPYAVKLWQIGNETSYDSGFDLDTAARKTLEFARAMKKADPDIRLIGWGDNGWAERMAEVAGEELDYIAFHNGFGPGGDDSPLRGLDYRRDPDRTWEFLMKAARAQEEKIAGMRSRVSRSGLPLALTECHFGLPGRNRNEVLSTWAAGVAYGAVMNVHERNGDVLKVSTLADFCGTRWNNNALMIPVPEGRPHLMPVAMMMGLYRKHVGTHGVRVVGEPEGLDVAASRTGDRLFLHVVNTQRRQPVKVRFAVPGMRIKTGRVSWFALEPELEIIDYRKEQQVPKEKALDLLTAWEFPAASVSAVELEIEPA
jgi:alpha-L-arabinofuranosidase